MGKRCESVFSCTPCMQCLCLAMGHKSGCWHQVMSNEGLPCSGCRANEKHNTAITEQHSSSQQAGGNTLPYPTQPANQQLVALL